MLCTTKNKIVGGVDSELKLHIGFFNNIILKDT